MNESHDNQAQLQAAMQNSSLAFAVEIVVKGEPVLLTIREAELISKKISDTLLHLQQQQERMQQGEQAIQILQQQQQQAQQAEEEVPAEQVEPAPTKRTRAKRGAAKS